MLAFDLSSDTTLGELVEQIANLVQGYGGLLLQVLVRLALSRRLALGN